MGGESRNMFICVGHSPKNFIATDGTQHRAHHHVDVTLSGVRGADVRASRRATSAGCESVGPT